MFNLLSKMVEVVETKAGGSIPDRLSLGIPLALILFTALIFRELVV